MSSFWFLFYFHHLPDLISRPDYIHNAIIWSSGDLIYLDDRRNLLQKQVPSMKGHFPLIFFGL